MVTVINTRILLNRGQQPLYEARRAFDNGIARTTVILGSSLYLQEAYRSTPTLIASGIAIAANCISAFKTGDWRSKMKIEKQLVYGFYVTNDYIKSAISNLKVVRATSYAVSSIGFMILAKSMYDMSIYPSLHSRIQAAAGAAVVTISSYVIGHSSDQKKFLKDLYRRVNASLN